MRKKIAFVDCDAVLFNIAAFKLRCFESLGVFLEGKCVPDKVFALYKESKNDGLYDPDRHIALLSEASGCSVSDLRKKFEDFMRREAHQFMYADAELFLQRLAEVGYEVWIATAGVEWFQEYKIPIDFYRCIAGVKVTRDQTKTSVIGQFADPEKDDIVLFDDSKNVINTMRIVFPNVFTVQVVRDRDANPYAVAAIAHEYALDLEEAFGRVLYRNQI